MEKCVAEKSILILSALTLSARHVAILLGTDSVSNSKRGHRSRPFKSEDGVSLSFTVWSQRLLKHGDVKGTENDDFPC